jgi:hypothetical protein
LTRCSVSGEPVPNSLDQNGQDANGGGAQLSNRPLDLVLVYIRLGVND